MLCSEQGEPGLHDESALPASPWPLVGTRGISSFWLKLVAIVAMTCDHAGLIFYSHLPLEARCVLIGLGGITFPVMAFLLVEGYVHTSNLKRYAMRLAVFALVSEAPFWLFLGHKGNVLFTLLLSLGLLWVFDNVKDLVVRMVAALGILLASAACDWGILGPAMVLLFYRGYGTRIGVAAAVLLAAVFGGAGLGAQLFEDVTTVGSWVNLPFFLYAAVGNTAALPLAFAYNGTRGAYPLKWFFYAFYPGHILVLGLLHLGMFGTMPALMVGFG